MRMLLFIIGVALLPTDTYARHARIANLPPVSAYTEAVLQRAQDGMGVAEQQPTDADDEEAVERCLRIVDDAILQSVDTQLTITEQQRDLPEYTACLHIDIELLRAKMHAVQEAMRAACQRRSGSGARLLAHVHRFLDDRVRYLLRGARSPTLVDESWGVVYEFDPPATVFCCSAADRSCLQTAADDCPGTPYRSLSACIAGGCAAPDSQESDDRLCPFDTDYTPPTSFGYGCDLSILNRYGEHRAMAAEHDALQTLITERNQFLTDLRPFLQNAQMEEELTVLDEIVAGRQHRKRFNCDGREGDGNSADQSWLKQVAHVERRGPFHFLSLDDFKIMRIFMERRNDHLGLQREQADYLKYPGEFTAVPSGQTAAEGATPILLRIPRDYFRGLFNDWSQKQATQESQNFAHFTEPRFFLQASLQPLRAANRRLSTLASDLQEGVRGFARDLAYFIRRSCPYRPCNDTLDRVLKIVLQDSCFPYASGEYLDDPDIEQTCRNQADLDR